MAMKIAVSLSVVILLGAATAWAATPARPQGLRFGTGTPPPPPTGAYEPPPCVAGSGDDYRVGPSQTYAAIGDVPWDQVGPGDTVRIYYRPEPYREKILLWQKGTASQPIRVCGVPGPGGERPIIDGQDAVTPASMPVRDTDAEIRAVVEFNRTVGGDFNTYYAEHIIFDGFWVRNGYQDHTFQNAAGATVAYDGGAACIRLDRARNITIRNNEISHCGNGLFGVSYDDVSRSLWDIMVEGNYFHDHSLTTDDRKHASYLQGMGLTYQFNYYGPNRPGAQGGNLKDRSAGTVVRYNYIEAVVRALDLVECQEHGETCIADPRYRETFVYGNSLRNLAGTRLVHYGGDVLPEYYRRGTLYFYNNTVAFNIDQDRDVSFFRLTTNLETAEIFNNILVKESPLGIPSLGNEAGIHNLGVNWILQGWRDGRSSFSGTINGRGNLITGAQPPVSFADFTPLAGAQGDPVIDVAQDPPAAVAAHPVLYDVVPDHVRKRVIATPRAVRGARGDLGSNEAR